MRDESGLEIDLTVYEGFGDIIEEHRDVFLKGDIETIESLEKMKILEQTIIYGILQALRQYWELPVES